MIHLARHGKLEAAVVLLAIGMAIAWTIDRSNTPAFAQVIANIENAKSLAFASESRMAPAGGEVRFYDKRVYAAGDFFREEELGTQADLESGNSLWRVEVGNLRTGEGLEIDYRERTARKTKFSERRIAKERRTGFIKAFSTLMETDAELVGEGSLNGREVDIYRLKRLKFPLGEGTLKEGELAEVWVGRESGLPVQVLKKTFYADGKGTIEISCDEFQWNQPLDPALFKLTIPDGFQVIDANAPK